MGQHRAHGWPAHLLDRRGRHRGHDPGTPVSRGSTTRAWLHRPLVALAVSIAIYSLTIAWMLTLVPAGARLARAVATLAAVALGVEIATITAPAARGVPSHVNNQTALDARLFKVMGASIILVWVATLVLALLLARQRLADRVLASGLRWGLAVSLLGMLVGVLMVDPVNQWVQRSGHGPPTALDGAHTVGAPDGGPGVPVANWSLHAGDLRAPHFVGIHALQLLALVAWLLGRHARRLDGTPCCVTAAVKVESDKWESSAACDSSCG